MYLEWTGLVVRSLTFELKEWQLNPTAGFMNNVLSIGSVSLLIWSIAKVHRKIYEFKHFGLYLV
jgi:hypothetical protein